MSMDMFPDGAIEYLLAHHSAERSSWTCAVCSKSFPILMLGDVGSVIEVENSDAITEGYAAIHMAVEHRAVV